MAIAVKFFGAFAIIICGYLAGQQKAAALKSAAVRIAAYIHFIEDVEAELSYTNAVYSEILPKVDTKYHVLAEVKDSINSLFFEAVQGAGYANKEGELKRFLYYKTALEGCLDEATNSYNQNSKVYKSIGLYCGALLAILLI